jgi:hypothetical protein
MGKRVKTRYGEEERKRRPIGHGGAECWPSPHRTTTTAMTTWWIWKFGFEGVGMKRRSGL